MTDFDRREALRFLGFGITAMPLIGAIPSSLQAASRATDPDADALMHEVVLNSLRIKNNLTGDQAVFSPSDLHMMAGHLRLLDTMAETRGLKARLRNMRFPNVGELDRAIPELSASIAERITAVGLPTQHDGPERMYRKHREQYSGRLQSQLHYSLRKGTFLAEQASGLTTIAEMFKNYGGDIDAAGLIRKPGLNLAGNNIQFVALAGSQAVSPCQGLSNFAAMLSFQALILSFIPVPPLQLVALIEEIIAVILEVISIIYCH